MARIYIGRSTGIGSFERHVVLKMITPERANDLTAVNMFLDEARLAASLNHQNVAQVFEVGEDAGIHYLAMEYVHGQDLRAVLAKAGSQGTRIPLELALTVVAGAAAGLHHAHERRGPDGTPLGIVHRDVSPSNIMIGYDGAVKLLDFGIAKATARSVETQSGIIKGKFAYMAPEQCRGREVDRRSDVFSLGIILYEISTQHRCFRADSDFDTMHRIVTGDVVRPTRLVQGYPQALEAIVMKALAVDAAQRYQSAGLLLEALESFAVSARMSLSTMGLGRFMRDMFGEVQEPWLNTAATKVLLPAKESTISQTNGQSSTSEPRLQTDPPLELNETGIPDDDEDDGRFVDSDKMEAAKTILDLPRNPAERHADHDEQRVEWNAKSYPSTSPAVASKDTLRPDANIQAAYARDNLEPPTLQLSDSRRSTPQSFPHASVPPPLGSGELPLPPPPPPGNQFQMAHSSGASIPSPLAPPRTKHGYASGAPMTRGDMSYPGYAQPEPVAEMELKPNRRPLIIGLLIVLLGAGAIAFVMLRGNDEYSPEATPEGTGSTDPGSQAAADTEDSMVSVIIHSDPPGADVLIAGSKIGVTPLNTKNKRGTTIQQLTVHKEGYVDFTKTIDLGGDYENRNIKLVRIEDAKGSSAEPSGDKGSDAKDTGKDTGSEPKTDAGAKTGTTPTIPPTTKTGTGTTGTGTTGTGMTGTGTTGTGTTGAKTGTKTGTTKTGTTKTTGEKTGGDKTTTGEKAPVEKTGDKTSGDKTSGDKTSGDKTSGDKTSGDKTSGDKAGDKPKQPKCQPPGPNVDPFSSIPICKTP